MRSVSRNLNRVKSLFVKQRQSRLQDDGPPPQQERHAEAVKTARKHIDQVYEQLGNCLADYRSSAGVTNEKGTWLKEDPEAAAAAGLEAKTTLQTMEEAIHECVDLSQRPDLVEQLDKAYKKAFDATTLDPDTRFDSALRELRVAIRQIPVGDEATPLSKMY